MSPSVGFAAIGSSPLPRGFFSLQQALFLTKWCRALFVARCSHRLDPQAVADMKAMQMVMDLGRSAREKRGISLKTPVKGITVVCKDEGTLSALEKLQSYVKGELNAWEVRGGQDWRGCQERLNRAANMATCVPDVRRWYIRTMR